MSSSRQKCIICFYDDHEKEFCPTLTQQCKYCDEIGHVTKTCPKYVINKKLCSKNSYIGELKSEDNKGCCAAGIFPYRYDSNGKMFILIAGQTRNEIAAYNFLGGKRDTESETAKDIAIREFFEETTPINSKNSIIPIRYENTFKSLEPEYNIYFNKSKYVLCVYNLDVNDEEAENIEQRLDYDEIDHLLWVSIDNILQNKIFHPWIMEIIDYMTQSQELKSFIPQKINVN